jgi:molybdopterin-synthase adenylyltransferase
MSDAADMQRYHRQMLLEGIGEAGQRRLAGSHACIVGCGALGCTIADLLARAGVGTLTIADRDTVELTNLQRQSLFDEEDARQGLPKADAARRRLERVNSLVLVRALVADVAGPRAEGLLFGEGQGPAVLLDGTDNFETRYLLNDLSVKRGVPYIYGGVVASRGMQATFVPGRAGCLRCMFEDLPVPGSTPTCDTAGVLGPAVAIVGACQAADAIKVLLGREDLLSRTLLDIDLWSNQRRRLELTPPRPDCPCCGRRRFEFLDDQARGTTAALCGRGAVQVSPGQPAGVDLQSLAARLRPHGEFAHLPGLLVRGELRGEAGEGGPLHLTVFADGRAIVKGTQRPERARAVYARYVGM